MSSYRSKLVATFCLRQKKVSKKYCKRKRNAVTLKACNIVSETILSGVEGCDVKHWRRKKWLRVGGFDSEER